LLKLDLLVPKLSLELAAGARLKRSDEAGERERERLEVYINRHHHALEMELQGLQGLKGQEALASERVEFVLAIRKSKAAWFCGS
jgi:hypothetical protein